MALPELTAVPPDGPMTPRPYRVRGAAVAPPGPGQFNMLWAFGVGEAPISLAGLDGDVLIHTIRRVGGVTNALCDARPGDQIGVRGPFGTGWDVDRAHGRDVIVIAGGLGVAPVRPIVTEVIGRRSDFGRAAILIGARTPEGLLYRDELAEWRSHLDLDVEVTVVTAPPSWRGDVGVVTRLIGRTPTDPTNTTAYVCGPEIMMRFCAAALIDCGVDPGEVFVSLERNMHCAIGHCGHCQLGSHFICRDGPVLPWPDVEALLRIRER